MVILKAHTGSRKRKKVSKLIFEGIETELSKLKDLCKTLTMHLNSLSKKLIVIFMVS